jgi:copper(I)-binding protein
MKQSGLFRIFRMLRLIRATLCPLLALAAVGYTVPAVAQPAAVKDAWVRAPAPGQAVAGVYMEITAGTNLWLVAVSSPAAGRAELHASSMEGGVMRMRAIESLELPGGRAVRLAPGGLHIMLLDLKQPLKRGDQVPVSLTVVREDRSGRAVFSVRAQVRDAEPAGSHRHH